MFEFGRDLRKLFENARESDDLGWLELIGADLVEAEARRETIDAGRVSSARPFAGWMRASALWREHARRTGRKTSLDRAASAASDAALLAARTALQTHGAIGYTAEHDLSHWLLRVQALHSAWGDPATHRRRVLEQLRSPTVEAW